MDVLISCIYSIFNIPAVPGSYSKSDCVVYEEHDQGFMFNIYFLSQYLKL